VTVLALGSPVLLMCMWARNKMGNAYLIKKGIEFLILASPISLHSKDFSIKHPFN